MPSSSLILRSCTTLVSFLNLFSVSVNAASSGGYIYSLQKDYSGSSFFNEWDFYNDADPNKGFVTYVDKQTASNSGLIGFGAGGAFVKVDSVNRYDPNTPFRGNNGYGRPSVRIVSQQSFYHGLVIADFKHMPSGCGTWPAFWTLGAEGQWPYSGEIDILEGVNDRSNGLAALHTGGQCQIAGDSRTMTGSLQGTDCIYDVSTGQGAAGCAILDTDNRAYGAGLNAAGGSVFAIEWTSDAIKIWSFPESSVPVDITGGSPDPSSWGLPAQIFNGPDCNIDDVIKPQKLIMNTNFCGDFGEAVWNSEGCAASTGYSSCAAYVAGNPGAFADAYWEIGSIRYYQQIAAPVTTTSTTTTDLTTVSTAVATTTSTSVDAGTSSTADTSTSTTISTSASLSTVSDALTSGTSTTLGSGFDTTYTLSISTTTSVTATTTAVDPFTTTSTSDTNTVGPILTSISLLLPTTLTNSLGPILTGISTASGPSTTTPSTLITGDAQSSVFLPPMGSGVPINPEWNTFQAGVQWQSWSTNTPAVLPTTWALWSGQDVTTTLTKTWIEPCETGWATKTTWIIATHCGCTETPVPTVPMKVITTDCPEAWGFTTPVVITVPDTAAVTWQAWPTKPTGKQEYAQTWLPLAIKPTGNDNVDENWSQWSVAPTGKGDNVQDWSSWSAVPMNKNNEDVAQWSAMSAKPTDKNNVQSWVGWNTDKAPIPDSTWVTWTTTKASTDASTWAAWSDARPITPTLAPQPAQAWSGVPGNPNSNPYVAKWTGAASKTSVGAGVLGVAFAVVALVL